MAHAQSSAVSSKFWRVLAIDYGTRRVGIAISDPTRLIAQGLATLSNNAELIGKLREVVREYSVQKIVVGMPYTLKGEIGEKGREVRDFILRLESEFTIPILTWDERFTTTLAQRTIQKLGTKKMQRRRKGRVDEMASRFLLQSYLDSRKE